MANVGMREWFYLVFLEGVCTVSVCFVRLSRNESSETERWLYWYHDFAFLSQLQEREREEKMSEHCWKIAMVQEEDRIA